MKLGTGNLATWQPENLKTFVHNNQLATKADSTKVLPYYYIVEVQTILAGLQTVVNLNQIHRIVLHYIIMNFNLLYM